MARKGIWNGPKVKHVPRRHYKPRHDISPIVLTGLWDELNPSQQSRLAGLGFDKHSWDNNVREQRQDKSSSLEDGELWVPGTDHPRMYEVLTGDRASVVLPHIYETGTSL